MLDPHERLRAQDTCDWKASRRHHASMTDTPTSRIPNWSQLLLAAILVVLVGGAFWLKTRPKPAIRGAAATESTGTLLARGIQAHNAQHHDEAIELYHKVLQREPAHPQAHYNIAQIYNARGQYAQAQWEYEAALKADPTFLDARLNLGVALSRQRQFAQAAEAFGQVLKASPKNATALFDLGITLIDLGRAQEASRYLTAAVRESPKWADAHYYLGLALERQRQLAEAKAAFQKTLELNPRTPNAYLALSRVYMAQGNRRLAVQALAKATELNPALTRSPFPGREDKKEATTGGRR